MLSVADLRAAIDSVTTEAVPGSGSVGLSDTKAVVLSVGGKVYPLTQVSVGFRGGVFVLELAGPDVPPCGYCGKVGGHVEYPCPSYLESQQFMHGASR